MLFLQQKKPNDFVISTGKQYTVKDFINLTAENLNMEIKWKGEGINEKGYDEKGNCIVAIDPKYFRATEVESLLGDSSKAKKELGWHPKTSLEELVKEMVSNDFEEIKRQLK